jgi:large subunit ribosomal protein L23
MQNLHVLLGPVITEKSMSEASKGRFTFSVSYSSTKHEIKKAIEEQFKVNVIKISTVVIKGRSLRTGIRRVERVKNPFKKASVTLKAGQKIGLFDVGGQK